LLEMGKDSLFGTVSCDRGWGCRSFRLPLERAVQSSLRDEFRFACLTQRWKRWAIFMGPYGTLPSLSRYCPSIVRQSRCDGTLSRLPAKFAVWPCHLHVRCVRCTGTILRNSHQAEARRRDATVATGLWEFTGTNGGGSVLPGDIALGHILPDLFPDHEFFID